MHVSNQELRGLIRDHQQKIREATGARQKRARAGIKVIHRQRGSRISERLAELILLLCTNLAQHASWRRYTYKQDLISAGVIDCMRAVPKIDLSRGTSCFGYLTTCAWRGFCKELDRQKAAGFTHRNSDYPEMSTMPTLLLGTFDAQGLSDALRAREANLPTT